MFFVIWRVRTFTLTFSSPSLSVPSSLRAYIIMSVVPILIGLPMLLIAEAFRDTHLILFWGTSLLSLGLQSNNDLSLFRPWSPSTSSMVESVPCSGLLSCALFKIFSIIKLHIRFLILLRYQLNQNTLIFGIILFIHTLRNQNDTLSTTWIPTDEVPPFFPYIQTSSWSSYFLFLS